MGIEIKETSTESWKFVILFVIKHLIDKEIQFSYSSRCKVSRMVATKPNIIYRIGFFNSIFQKRVFCSDLDGQFQYHSKRQTRLRRESSGKIHIHIVAHKLPEQIFFIDFINYSQQSSV